MAPLSSGEQLAKAATGYVGTPFRLHGRDAAYGLDCVGLVYASLRAIGCDPRAPTGYRLRNTDPSRWFEFARLSGLADHPGPVATGDVVLLKLGAGQHHLAIATDATHGVHAHASLRRVVIQRFEFSPILAKIWRLPDHPEMSSWQP